MRRAGAVALVTCAEYPSLTPDDRPLVAALAARGLEPVPAVWNDPAVPWAEFGAVVPRSCWDYHLHAAEFARWLDRLEEAGARVHNPVPILRWNMRKTYLKDLGASGVPVMPTVWVAAASGATLRGIAGDAGWERIVVKPTVSASGWETWVVARAEVAAAEPRFAAQLAAGDLMIQPFAPSILTEGELSFVFVAGRFCHAVRKRPRAGDFRVQEEHGGSAEAAAPAPAHVAQAARALGAAPAPPLYARVDATVVEGSLVVTELELIEPKLYFGFGPAAAERLAAALAAAVATGSSSA